MEAVIQALQQIADPSSKEAPVLGAARQFNEDTFGVPPWLDPELPEEERMQALAMALVMGKTGDKGQAAAKFGRTLRNSGFNNNMLRNIDSGVEGFTRDFGNPNRLLSNTGSNFKAIGNTSPQPANLVEAGPNKLVIDAIREALKRVQK